MENRIAGKPEIEDRVTTERHEMSQEQRPTNGSPNAAAAGTLKVGDLSVNRLGYGAMRITGDGIWGEPPDPEGAKNLLQRALDLGINLIDTADSYGPDVSERLIGEALHPYPEDLVVATKGGLVRGGPGDWRTDGRPEHLKEACEGSLKRLKLDAIQIYQLHAPDRNVPFEESVGAVAELWQAGKVENVGLSNVSVEQLEAALRIVPVVSVQNRYSLSSRDTADVLEACEERGIAFLPYFPLAAGRLSRPGGSLDEISASKNATQSQVALAWLLGSSPVTIPIPGTSSAEHLEENVGAASVELTDDELDTLSQAS